jgi:hypothetical protein
LKISQFVYFMILILFHKSNCIHSISSFKILNDVTLCIVRSEIFNLNYEMETLHFISNGEDHCPPPSPSTLKNKKINHMNNNHNNNNITHGFLFSNILYFQEIE